MPSLWASARVGASVSVLGAVLVLSSDFIMSSIHPASLGPQVLWLVIPPALIVLGIGLLAFFRKLPLWLLVLDCVVSILGFLLQAFVYLLSQAFACFDVCNPESHRIGFWLLLGLGGFLLNVIGAFVALKK